MSELRPCPFCGKPPAVGLNGYPRCPIPGIGTHAGGMTVEEWQTRPLEDALQKRVEELEKFIKEAMDEIEKEWVDGVADEESYNYDDVYQSGVYYALSILRKHGLIGGNK